MRRLSSRGGIRGGVRAMPARLPRCLPFAASQMFPPRAPSQDPDMMTTQDPIGSELAALVADRLLAGQVLADRHPEYCGAGLAFVEGVFVHAEVYDGEILTPSAAARMRQGGQSVECEAFASREAFVAWLAAQTDEALSGLALPDEWRRGNQRVTAARLRDFVGLGHA